MTEGRLALHPDGLSANHDGGAGTVPFTWGAGHDENGTFRVHYLELSGTIFFGDRYLGMDVFCELNCLEGHRLESENLAASLAVRDTGVITSARLVQGALGLGGGTVVDPKTGQRGTIQLTGSSSAGIGTYAMLRSVEEGVASAWQARRRGS